MHKILQILHFRTPFYVANVVTIVNVGRVPEGDGKFGGNFGNGKVDLMLIRRMARLRLRQFLLWNCRRQLCQIPNI